MPNIHASSDRPAQDYIYHPAIHQPGQSARQQNQSEAAMADADLQTTREREAKALTRIQVLTPLSVLVSAGANIVCALVLKKNLGENLSSSHLNSL